VIDIATRGRSLQRTPIEQSPSSADALYAATRWRQLVIRRRIRLVDFNVAAVDMIVLVRLRGPHRCAPGAPDCLGP
jgi:hypothetical protein